ncbi:hypothetical protein DFH06DRAFT_1466735 [Mycena polygramma]|nr:hypothetical protein DFH06DRAFT_1466735 [Mycena polygramma]
MGLILIITSSDVDSAKLGTSVNALDVDVCPPPQPLRHCRTHRNGTQTCAVMTFQSAVPRCLRFSDLTPVPLPFALRTAAGRAFLPARAARCTRRPRAGFFLALPRGLRWLQRDHAPSPRTSHSRRCPGSPSSARPTTSDEPWTSRSMCEEHLDNLPLRCLRTSAAALKPKLVVHTVCIPAVFEVGITPEPANASWYP